MLAVPACAVAFATAGSASGVAQVLQHLHVRTFTLSIDRPAPHVGEQLHLTLYVHVDEPVARLDNVTLPDLAGFDVYGDERHCAPARRGGTDCGEVLLVAPKETGTLVLGPASLDAVDARNGKPSRFASNIVTLSVGADPMAPMRAVRGVVVALLRAFLVLLGCAAVVVLALVALRRRPPPQRSPLPPPASVVPARDDGAERWRVLVEALSREPSRARVIAVREELRGRVGAREEETFGDLLARNAAGDDRHLFDALLAVERAAFIDDARLASAIADALPVLERVNVTARATP